MKKKQNNPSDDNSSRSSLVYNIADLFGTKPSVEILGNSRLTVEGIRGIHEYSKTRIRVSIGRMSLQIKGRGLDLKCISPTSVIVSGFISGVEYII